VLLTEDRAVDVFTRRHQDSHRYPLAVPFGEAKLEEE
jgi:hypothetical protein